MEEIFKKVNNCKDCPFQSTRITKRRIERCCNLQMQRGFRWNSEDPLIHFKTCPLKQNTFKVEIYNESKTE